MPWRLESTHKRKGPAYQRAKQIVRKQVNKVSGDPVKAAFFGKYRYQAKVEYDKQKKKYRVYKDKMW